MDIYETDHVAHADPFQVSGSWVSPFEKWKQPRDLVFLGARPEPATGKVPRFELRRWRPPS